MNVRLAQPQSMLSRPGVAARGPAMSPARENEKQAPGGKSAAAGGAKAKGAGSAQARGAAKNAGAQEARQEGLEAGALEGGGGVEAHETGFDGTAGSLEGDAGRGRFELLHGEGRQEVPQPAARPQLRPVVPEQPQQVARREEPSARRQALEGRAKLRSLVMDLLLGGMNEVCEQLRLFLESPHQLGVVNLAQVLSESSVTLELWKSVLTHAEHRMLLVQSLSLSSGVSDPELLRALMAEVHESFVEFQKGLPGREVRKRYEALIQGCEAIQVLPVVVGHDMGPMLAELDRLGLRVSLDFVRTLLLHPSVLAVGFSSGNDGPQVLVSGLEVLDLATLVAQLRQLNPVLSNRQVLNLMSLVTTDLKLQRRKALGMFEVEEVQEFARQLLRLQFVRRLCG